MTLRTLVLLFASSVLVVGCRKQEPPVTEEPSAPETNEKSGGVDEPKESPSDDEGWTPKPIGGVGGGPGDNATGPGSTAGSAPPAAPPPKSGGAKTKPPKAPPSASVPPAPNTPWPWTTDGGLAWPPSTPTWPWSADAGTSTTPAPSPAPSTAPSPAPSTTPGGFPWPWSGGGTK